MYFKAAILQTNKSADLIQKQMTKPSSRGVTVRVHGCFVCGSDLKTLKYGNYRVSEDRVMGHGVSGTVVDVGAKVVSFKVGDRVALGADFPCMVCDNCLNSNFGFCTTPMAIGHEHDGGFAQYINLPDAFVSHGPITKISDNLSLRLAALSEPVACCLRGFKEKFFPTKVSEICIYGAGPIGAIIATIAKIRFPEANIVVIDPNSRRRMLLEKLEIGDLWIAGSEDLKDTYHPDVIFVACSVISAQKDAMNFIRAGGSVCLFGGLPNKINQLTIDPNLIHYKEVCVYGTTGSDKHDLQKSIDIIEKNKTNFEKIISCEVPLTKMSEAIEIASSGDELKVFVECESV
jgi:L-iditol 2-dehydrogenase